MANLHFAVATPNYKVLEHFNDFADAWVHELVDRPPRDRSAPTAASPLPERPGLGLRLNHDACARASAHGRAHPAVRGGLGEQARAERLTRRRSRELVLDARPSSARARSGTPSARACSSSTSCAGACTSSIPSTGRDRIVEVGQPVGAVAPPTRGDLVLAARDGFCAARSRDRRDHAASRTSKPDVRDNRMNDGYVRRARAILGRARWAGRAAGRAARCIASIPTARSRDARRRADLERHRLEPGRPADVLRRHRARSRIDVFDFDEATGTIATGVRSSRFRARAGYPDGLIVDADGVVWVALWGGGAVHRYAPDGTLDLTVADAGVAIRTNARSAGRTCRDLYITTACDRARRPRARARSRIAGGLFRLRPGVRGRPPHRFAG